MKKNIFIASAFASAIVLAFASPKDPILMTVNGHDIPVSEFEYLRNKNNSQQQQPQSLDEYLEMFTDYKLKVAAAEAAGIDTTQKFITEYEQFRTELSDPYLVDRNVREALIRQAYEHSLENLIVSHIMLDASQEGLADSLYQVVISGQTPYEEVASEYSIDRASKSKGGLMGAMPAGRYPWPFEEAAYNTPVGEISQPVNSGFGWHIIRVESREPAKGEVEASHILRLTRGKSDEEQAAQLALIDSIYSVATPENFAELARKFSEDPGSGARGGALGYFAQGMMVQPFDSIAFAMNDGEISAPFKTNFGYHIIYRTGHKAPASLEEQRKALDAQIDRDDRALQPKKAFITKYIKDKKGGIEEKNIAKLASTVPANGLDSASIEKICASNLVGYKLGKNKVEFSKFLSPNVLESLKGASSDDVKKYIENATQNALENDAWDMARQDLLDENVEYANLLNEYRDGILLYEISNENVWERASKDKDGLEAFFKANIDRYKWDAPKFKSVIIFATNDSTLNEALAYAETIDSKDPAKFVEDLRKKFGREIKVERVIAAKGENAITDYLAFGAEKPEVDPNQKWKCYAAFGGRIIDAPEEAADVRGLAVTDYQTQLEKDWLQSLRANYPVKIDKKVLDTLR